MTIYSLHQKKGHSLLVIYYFVLGQKHAEIIDLAAAVYRYAVLNLDPRIPPDLEAVKVQELPGNPLS